MMNYQLSEIDGLALRDWQSVALSRWVDNGMRGIAEVATAGGKTRFALECAKLFLDKYGEGRVVIYVPTTALQDQWAVTISDLFEIPLSQISTWSDCIIDNSKFQILVINTAREKFTSLNRKSNETFLIADECHRYASKENSLAFGLLTRASLGISATAEREYDDGLEEILVPNLGRVIYEYSLLEASFDEVIAPFEMVNVEVEMSDSEQAEYNNLTRRIGIALRNNDLEKVSKLSILRASVSKKATIRIPVACSIVQSELPKRILVFHEDIDSASQIYKILEQRKNKVAIYHSEMSPQLRRLNLKKFRKGLIDVLVCIRALDEGVDIPEAEVAVIAAATNSRRQRIQRIGRVVRKNPGKDTARIYSVYATDSERDILLQESNSFAGVAKVKWLRLENNA